MWLVSIFWLSAFMIFFAYIGYPFSLKLLLAFRRYKPAKRYITPSITFIISAYNEEKRIREKIENTLDVDYPRSRMQVIVVSDGSTDRTNAIIREYEKEGVELIELRERRGKESGQNEAVKRARGEILVFSDVATTLEKCGLTEIVANFADPQIGCVSSVDRLLTNGESQTGGEGLYVKYEMWLRTMESSVKSVVGLSGSFFAARKEVCFDFSTNMQSDFKTLLNSMKMGLRGISDPEAIGYYPDIKDKSREFDRKVRTVLRGLTVFFNHLEFVNVFRFGLFSYMYVCHKLLRWSVPFFLLIALFSGTCLIKTTETFKIIGTFQLAFYFVAFVGLSIPKLNTVKLIKVFSFFVMVNVSILVAWIKYLKGERIVLWQSSIR
jgi:glycosyltransferase involved in cell wall biosynthesis